MRFRIGLVIAVLALVALVVVNGMRHEAQSPSVLEIASKPEAAKSPSSVELAPSEESVESVRAPVAQPTPPTTTQLAKLKVLVVEKRTHMPLAQVFVTERLAHPPKPGTGAPNAHKGRTATTDKSGTLEFEVPGEAELFIIVDGSEAEATNARVGVQPIGAGLTYELTIELDTSTDTVFWLQAIDEETHAPLADAVLRPASGIAEKARADARGLLSVRILSTNQVAFRIEARDHAFVNVASDVGHETPDKALVIALARSAALNVHVIDAAGAPMVDAKVMLSSRSRFFKPEGVVLKSRIIVPEPHWQLETNAQGFALFEDLPAGADIDVTITEPASWKLANSLWLQAGEKREVECRVGGGALVEGRVVDQFSKPVTHRSVRLEADPYKRLSYFEPGLFDRARLMDTDDDGHFAFVDVAPGTWRIGPDAQRDSSKEPSADDVAALAQVLEITEGMKHATVNIRVDRGLAIRGRVHGSHGEAVSSASVSARAAEGAASPRDVAVRDGSFVLGPLAAGRYELRATDRRNRGDDAPSDPVFAEAGKNGVVLQLRGSPMFVGRVVDTNGSGVVARLWATGRSSKTSLRWERDTASDGSFELHGLEPGTFDFVATTADGRLGVLANVSGDAEVRNQDVIVRVQSAGHVRVRYAGEFDRSRVSVIANGVIVDNQSIDKNATKEMTAPFGKVTLRLTLRNSAKPIDREIEVREGSIDEVVLTDRAQ